MRRRAGLLAAIALVVGLGAAPGVAAADPVFQPATATATFGTSINVEQRVTLPAGVARVEAIVRAGMDARTYLATVPSPTVGDGTLRYGAPEIVITAENLQAVYGVGVKVARVNGTLVCVPEFQEGAAAEPRFPRS